MSLFIKQIFPDFCKLERNEWPQTKIFFITVFFSIDLNRIPLIAVKMLSPISVLCDGVHIH